jgi:methionine-rich copper-binding protein CopC
MGGAWRRVGRRSSVRAAIVIIFAALATGAVADAAAAHTELAGSEPADGATLRMAPSSVELRFSQRLGSPQATVTITGPDGARLPNTPATVDGPRVVVPLGALPAAGRYAAAYRVIAADGDPVTGEIDFMVASAPAASPTHPPSPAASATSPAPTASSSPSPAAAAASDEGGFPAWAVVLVVGGVVLLGCGAGAWLALRRARP